MCVLLLYFVDDFISLFNTFKHILRVTVVEHENSINDIVFAFLFIIQYNDYKKSNSQSFLVILHKII